MINYLRFILVSLLLVINVTANANGTTQQNLISDSTPWIVNSNNFLMINFKVNAKEITPLLKTDIALKVDKDGLVNTMIEVYSAEKISGIAEYSIAFIVVETESYASRDGTPGHYAIWGIASPTQSVKFLNETLGFPYQDGTIKIEYKKPKITATISDATGALLEIEAAEISDKSFSGKGMVNMLATKSNQLFKSEVPFISEGFFANTSSFKVITNKDPLLKLLASTSPAWSIVADKQIFSYSHAIQIKP